MSRTRTTPSQRGDAVDERDLRELLAHLEFGEAVPDGQMAAAIASAIGAHLADRRRALASEERRQRETVDNWTFRNRLDAVESRPRRCPTNVERGGEWQAAARSL